jgi:hypothetical protein
VLTILPWDRPEPPYIVWKADGWGWWKAAGLASPVVNSSPITFHTDTLQVNILGNVWFASDATGSGNSGNVHGVAPISWCVQSSRPTYGRLSLLDGGSILPCRSRFSDAAAMRITRNVDRQVAEASTTMKRQVKTPPAGLEDLFSSLTGKCRQKATPLPWQTRLSRRSVPNDAQVASLTLLFGTSWTIDYAQVPGPNGRFTNLRNLPGSFGDGGAGAKVAAPALLGSNWKGVTALFLPVGNSLEDGAAACPGDCLDIRAANDTLAVPNRTWGLPDLVISGQAQTLFFNKPGELTVFSTDHPNAAEALAVPFSFRTFEGDVTVDVKVCPNSGSSEKVVVITENRRWPCLVSSTPTSGP